MNRKAWTKITGTTASTYTYGNKVCVDNDNFIYTVGDTNDPYLDGATLPGPPYGASFLVKRNSSGARIWTKFLGTGTDYCYHKDVSSYGDYIYVTGYTVASIDSQPQIGMFDAYVVKYDKSGNLIWSRQIGATAVSAWQETLIEFDLLPDSGTWDLDVDAYTLSGLAYNIDASTLQTQIRALDTAYDTYTVTGDFTSGFTIIDVNNPTPATYSATSYLTSGVDPVVISESTTVPLARGGITSKGVSVCIDSSNNVYLIGYTEMIPDFLDRGEFDSHTLRGTNDGFIVKYNSSGVKQWSEVVRPEGDSDFVFVNSGTIDSSNLVSIVGYASVIEGETALSSTDAFVAQFDNAGSRQWLELTGEGLGSTEARSICSDSSGNLYVSGVTNSAVDGQTNIGALDSFILKYQSDGTKVWTKLYGVSLSSVVSYGVVCNSLDYPYMTGSNLGTYLYVAEYDTDGLLLSTAEENISISDTQSYGIARDGDDNIYISGTTAENLNGQTLISDIGAFIIKYGQMLGNSIFFGGD